MITALICQADSPDRQTISPHALAKEKLLIASSFSLKAGKTVNIHYCCSLVLMEFYRILQITHSTAHMSLLTKSSAHIATSTTDIFGIGVKFLNRRADPCCYSWQHLGIYSMFLDFVFLSDMGGNALLSRLLLEGHIFEPASSCLKYPSIHFLYPLNPSFGSRGGWSLDRSPHHHRATQR